MSYNNIDKNWSENNKTRYSWLYNKLKIDEPNLDKNNYLLDYPKSKLLKFIFRLDLSKSSKVALLFTVAKYLIINKPKDTSIETFRSNAFKLKQQIEEADAENQLDDKEQYTHYNYNYFINILNNIDFKNINDIKSHYQYLILSLLIYAPPLRTSFYTSAIISNNNNHDDDKNYIWLTTKGKKRVYFIINKDKVSNSRKVKEDVNASLIEVENKTLIDIIYYSYEKYKRTYLFENFEKHTKISDSTLLSYLRGITKINKISVDTMRSIYITNAYNTNVKTLKDKQLLAKSMRHSAFTAAKSYYKVVNNENNNNNDANEEIDKLKKENEELKLKINELNEKILELQPDKKLMDRRRRDIIAKANKNKTHLKPETIKLYDLKFNEDTKQYY